MRNIKILDGTSYKWIYSFRFVLSHLIKKCRRETLLEYFEEKPNHEVPQHTKCCDVCSETERQEMVDCVEEITILLQAIQEISESGERKVRIV